MSVVRSGALLAFLACVGLTDVHAQVETGGYMKAFGIDVGEPLDARVGILRHRLQVGYATGALSADVWLDSELLSGSLFGSVETAAPVRAGTEAVDLTWNIFAGSEARLDQRVFRATLAYETAAFSVVAGRQRVGWGSGFIWTPTDRFNPISPTTLERDEPGGVDAVRVSVPFGPVSGIDLVAAPGPVSTSAGTRAA